MKNKGAINTVVFFFGLAIILSGFYIFIPEDKRSDIFYLDLVVVCFVYFLNYSNFPGLFFSVSNFNKQISVLGMRLYFATFYSVIAIAIILIGYFLKFEFKSQLFLQLIALFFLSIILVLAKRSNQHVQNFATEEANIRKGKADLLGALSKLELQLSRESVKWSNAQPILVKLKENARYVAPTTNSDAISIEQEILNEIQKCSSNASSNINSSEEEIIKSLNTCSTLLAQRKQIYSN